MKVIQEKDLIIGEFYYHQENMDMFDKFEFLGRKNGDVIFRWFKGNKDGYCDDGDNEISLSESSDLYYQ